MECLAGSFDVLSDEEIKAIHTGSLEILAETGMKVPLKRLLARLDDEGLRVDHKHQMVFFGADRVERAIETAPAQYHWHARNPGNTLVIGDHTVNYGIASTISTVIDLDGQRRPATIRDVYNISRLSNALDGMSDAYGAVWPSDAPPGCEHTHIFYSQVSQSDKPVRARLHGKTQGQDSVAMARIVAGGEQALKDRPMLMGLYSPMSPLAHTVEQLEGGLELIENGQLLVICPGVFGGATAPVTLAGLVTQQNAEFLGTLTIAQIVNPGAPIGYGTFSSVLDLRTGAGPMATPESCLIQSAVAQLGRFYSVPRRGYSGTDANASDSQAGLEVALKLFSGALAGLNLISHSAGFIDGGRAFSYANLILDNEIIAYVKRIIDGIKVSPDTLAVDLIKKAGAQGVFLTEAHTVEHMHSEIFLPELSNRLAYDAWQTEGEKTMAMKAHTKAMHLLESVEAPPLDPTIDRELKEYMKSVESRQN